MKHQERQEIGEERWPSTASELHRAVEEIRLRSQGQETTIGRVFEGLRDSGFLLGLLLLTLPFALPFPTTMGLSAPVGIMAMLSGAAVVLGRRPRIPQFIARRRLSQAWVARLASVMAKAAGRVHRFVRPRWAFMFWPGPRRGIGLGLIAAGFALGLPLPIPFTNWIPAVAIILLCLGTILEDGVTVLLGHGAGLGAWGYLCAVGEVTWSVIHRTMGLG